VFLQRVSKVSFVILCNGPLDSTVVSSSALVSLCELGTLSHITSNYFVLSGITIAL